MPYINDISSDSTYVKADASVSNGSFAAFEILSENFITVSIKISNYAKDKDQMRIHNKQLVHHNHYPLYHKSYIQNNTQEGSRPPFD